MSPREESWMPRAYPPEFRRRAVELARLREKPIVRIGGFIYADRSPPMPSKSVLCSPALASSASAGLEGLYR